MRGHGRGDNDLFDVSTLEQRQIDQAFPLVHVIAPELSVDRWRRYARGLLDRVAEGDCGIMTVRNDMGYIIGLYSYRAVDHLRHGRVLAVDDFVVLDLFNMAGATNTLLSSMHPVAEQCCCSAIETTLPAIYSSLADGPNQVLDCFRNAGHRLVTIHLSKDLAGRVVSTDKR